MSLPPTEAEQVLRSRLGAPINPVPHGERSGQDNDKVLGFEMPGGRVLALNRKVAEETHIWFQPPAPADIDGISIRPTPTLNSNLSGRLSVLNDRQGLQVEVESESALHQFLDWYAGLPRSTTAPASKSLTPTKFQEAFGRFQHLIELNDKGHAFTNFHEGVAAVWEDYKPRLRDLAIQLLSPEDWQEAEIGTGRILDCVINAIEIQDSRSNLTNNLVFWQNRFGHANREHRTMLEARSQPRRLEEFERTLFDIFNGSADEGQTFDALSALTEGKYPLAAYFYFLKDMGRFMPILPTTFDRAFKSLGVDLVTLHNCTWANYQQYNAALHEVQKMLGAVDGLDNVELIDAHSFCWMLERLPEGGGHETTANRKDSGRVLGARDKSIMAMRYSVEKTVRNSNGQVVERTVKNKDLNMDSYAFEQLLKSLLDLQENRCALTGIPFHFQGPDADNDLLPSADRIDSTGHYEEGNVQIVCQFINFWKGARDNEEFKRLLMLVRGEEA